MDLEWLRQNFSAHHECIVICHVIIVAKFNDDVLFFGGASEFITLDVVSAFLVPGLLMTRASRMSNALSSE